MNQLVNLLKNQTLDSHQWVDKLISDFPENKWFESEEVLSTNIAWQIGHLTLSIYYYNVVLIGCPQEDIANKIDLNRYSDFFVNGSKINEIQKHFTKETILENWIFLKSKSIEFISKLCDKDLESEIYKLPKEHPFAKTNLDAISWNIKHTMWHCGQIATLKRIIDKPFDLTTARTIKKRKGIVKLK